MCPSSCQPSAGEVRDPQQQGTKQAHEVACEEEGRSRGPAEEPRGGCHWLALCRWWGKLGCSGLSPGAGGFWAAWEKAVVSPTFPSIPSPGGFRFTRHGSLERAKKSYSFKKEKRKRNPHKVRFGCSDAMISINEESLTPLQPSVFQFQVHPPPIRDEVASLYPRGRGNGWRPGSLSHK